MRPRPAASMATPPTTTPLATDDAARLTTFARACRAAARIVSLYPPSHPAILAALDRVGQASVGAMRGQPYTITVLPETLVVDGQHPPKPDQAVVELAALLRNHLVDELTLLEPMPAATWHSFLLLLSRSPDDVRAEGGFSAAWQSAGGGPVDIRQIDYAEVLREREGGLDAQWDHIMASYLKDEPPELDPEVMTELQALAEDPERLAQLADRVLGNHEEGSPEHGRQSALLVKMLRALADFAARTAPDLVDRILTNITSLTPKLPPGTVLALAGGGSGGGGGASGPVSSVDLAAELRNRIDPDTAAAFVANTVSRGRAATARLAEAFQVLVPDDEQRQRVLGMASALASTMPFAKDPSFPDLWENASRMLTSYSDEAFVSEEYSQELSTARAHAVDVERISDDPPERVRAWVATVSDEQVRRLDQQILRDLLRIERREDAWIQVLDVAITLIDQLVLVGDVPLALELVDTLVEIGDRPDTRFRDQISAGIDRLRSDTLMRHVVSFLRDATDREVPEVARFCRMLGPPVMRPLAEALALEDNSRAVRRLREVLLGFGAAGRAYADELRQSANPSVRRTAVDLLRAFGGTEALPDLLRLLDDAEGPVQREALRAITEIGSDEAYDALRRTLASGTPQARDAIMQSVSWLRDERAAPIFVYILRNTSYAGAQEEQYRLALDAIGQTGSSNHDVIDALKTVLYRGEWWSWRRTSRLRHAAAAALRTNGTAEADAVLAEAVARGPRGVRRAAQAALVQPLPPPRRSE
jgi:HEAT repeat protein